jgi:hypothetical protein
VENVNQFLNYNWGYVFFGLILLIVVVVFILDKVDGLLNRFGITTKKQIEKEKSLERITKLEQHDKWQYDKLAEISSNISDIKTMLVRGNEEQKATTVATCRSTLYRLHNEFVSQGFVTKEGLKTFTEIGKVYEHAGGDDIFHDKLHPEVMSLPIKD